ncbi:MAG: HAD family hydrolase [Desulfobacteraceae bacterium]|nr:MAG: HAD family hydrolase [Desulfobacteraceae bacterium]
MANPPSQNERRSVNRNHIQAVAFDCDGVLFDSANANRAYYNHILLQFGLPEMTEEQFAYAQMHTVEEALALLIEDANLLAAVREYRRGMSYMPFIRYMEMEPQLRAVLARLRPHYKTAIATNRTDTMARVLEEHALLGLFDKVVTACDVPRAKPHPDQLLLLLEHFGITPSEMIFVGDSELDALAAEQARVPFLAYANPKLKADAHIISLGQVLGYLGL